MAARPALVWIDTPTKGIKSYIIIILHKQMQTTHIHKLSNEHFLLYFSKAYPLLLL